MTLWHDSVKKGKKWGEPFFRPRLELMTPDGSTWLHREVCTHISSVLQQDFFIFSGEAHFSYRMKYNITLSFVILIKYRKVEKFYTTRGGKILLLHTMIPVLE